MRGLEMDEVRSVGRLQFELSMDKIDEIRRLRVEGGFDDQKDLLNSAVTLLRWAMRHAQQGHAIAAVDEKSDKYYELQMPFLDYVAKQQQHK